MVSVTSASRYITSASHYHPRYQSRSSMYIRGLIPRNFAELAEAVSIESYQASRQCRDIVVPVSALRKLSGSAHGVNSYHIIVNVFRSLI